MKYGILRSRISININNLSASYLSSGFNVPIWEPDKLPLKLEAAVRLQPPDIARLGITATIKLGFNFEWKTNVTILRFRRSIGSDDPGVITIANQSFTLGDMDNINTPILTPTVENDPTIDDAD